MGEKIMSDNNITVTFAVYVKFKGKWEKEAKKQGLSLSEWIINKLNSDIDFLFQDVDLHNDIPEHERYFIKVNVPIDYKNYWVHSARKKGKKLRVWIVSKLNANIIY